MTGCSSEELERLARQLAEAAGGEAIPRITPAVEKLLDHVKDCIVTRFSGELVEAEEWLSHVRAAVSRLARLLGLAGFTYPREFGSFVQDPEAHLRKKLFNYVYDLARGRVDLREFERKATAAVRTSLRTNMRTAYQLWGLATVMALLAERGYELVYPEHRFLSFDRSGKQRLGIIPPNAVLARLSKGFISIFHEAPRPLGWEDTSDLQRIWSLYTALRPDAMAYSGMVMNMVDLSTSPPIKRPDVIIEFKELSDWYVRIRDLKGYFRKPLTAEEWRNKWLAGLFEGLADIMGVQRSVVEQRVEEGASLRLREYQLVKLYAKTYNPRYMILISRAAVPGDVRESLEEDGITVLDAVGFHPEKLEPLADLLDKISGYRGGEKIVITLPPEAAKLLEEAKAKLGVEDTVEAIVAALRRLLED
ncbi:hypothetical protein [Hyperthermus butylicus]|uniref:Conserved crenarchaeal protein n=1 Tax=Hyperthermus butylicus (strain DSM 5456 / JCM 9403 / PLM1-5) TaxID=415426 RepID=A2BJJ8_HYPBU|nr:hypothetical protein [Hyperthermus butylicus]ABM80159.1 conserved crenarchaeal protein [Hyperthermus butylicus DSM 5456]